MQEQRALTLNPTLAISSAAVVGVALLTSLCAQISIPIGPVPQTLQTVAVLGGSAYLGARRGLASMALYVAMGLVLPVYAHGDHGWSVLTAGTGSGGYLIGFIGAGYTTGLMRERLGWSGRSAILNPRAPWGSLTDRIRLP